jgi:hypothetical protein
MSARREFEALLQTDWAEIPALESFKVLATECDLEQVTEPTALIRQKSVSRSPNAPLNQRHVGVLLTLISPYEDFDRAADDLEDQLMAVLDYLGPRFQHDEATQVSFGGTNLAFDIPITLIATKE